MKPAPDLRRRELARIHCLKAEVGLDDGTYRDMLWTVARVRSAADLDFAGRQRVIAHLEACRRAGSPAAPSGAGAGEWAFVARRPAHEQRQWRYLIVLCREAGLPRGRQIGYVTQIVKNMHGYGDAVKNPPALWSGADLGNVINAMVYAIQRQRRAGRA
jgi:hypothetical protein